jgi:hypothetical protein
MFLGDGAAAEALTCEVLLAVYRQQGSRLDDRELLPRGLGFALRAAHKYQLESSRRLPPASQLETAIHDLPRLERAVVIMRNLLHMDWECVALATDLSQTHAHQVWAHGVFQLNDLLHKRSF